MSRRKIEQELAFRATTATLIVVVVSISSYYRHRAERASAEKTSSWHEEGLPTAIALRTCGLALMLSVMAYILNPRWMKWSSLDLPTSLRWTGAGIGAATLPLSYWVFASIGKNISSSVNTREDHKLVTSGPYRWVRHPLYSVGTKFFISLSLLIANWFTAVASLSVLMLLLVRLPKEEKKLIERFGEEYRAYMKRTGWLLPRFE